VTSSAVQTGFLTPEVAPKAAGATFHFLDLLVGPRCAELAVNRPEQYHFNPDSLLLSVLHFMLRLAEQPAFVGAMAEVPDYDEVILVKAVEVLATKQLGEYEHRVRLEGLAGAVAARRSAALSPTTHALEAVGLGGEPAAVDAAQLDASYAAALTPLAVGEFDASQPRAYNRHFAAMADAAAGDVSAASKRLGREIRDLRGKMALPVYAAGAIFVRHDGARLDKMRACITGPEGTPYEGGMFFFDVLFPQRYPDVPPLMELETTGMGTARFK